MAGKPQQRRVGQKRSERETAPAGRRQKKVGLARSGQKEKPHRRRTKKRKGDRWKEAGTSAHGNGARQRAIPPRRRTKKR